ncbi:hypothetical protein AVEN_54602-1 [Araneus ventricosus]|uniref:Uncharacterized protein n=1 Tax=Araneus ventricosus TaxID=182803 RepID=A0A4Y2BL18_ARAVE|nr:hypothetical protein AVEN_54602-1 [Araneus ventricosus]
MHGWKSLNTKCGCKEKCWMSILHDLLSKFQCCVDGRKRCEKPYEEPKAHRFTVSKKNPNERGRNDKNTPESIHQPQHSPSLSAASSTSNIGNIESHVVKNDVLDAEILWT